MAGHKLLEVICSQYSDCASGPVRALRAIMNSVKFRLSRPNECAQNLIFHSLRFGSTLARNDFRPLQSQTPGAGERKAPRCNYALLVRNGRGPPFRHPFRPNSLAAVRRERRINVCMLDKRFLMLSVPDDRMTERNGTSVDARRLRRLHRNGTYSNSAATTSRLSAATRTHKCT